jgi:hypothetical protein
MKLQAIPAVPLKQPRFGKVTVVYDQIHAIDKVEPLLKQRLAEHLDLAVYYRPPDSSGSNCNANLRIYSGKDLPLGREVVTLKGLRAEQESQLKVLEAAQATKRQTQQEKLTLEAIAKHFLPVIAEHTQGVEAGLVDGLKEPFDKANAEIKVGIDALNAELKAEMERFYQESPYQQKIQSLHEKNWLRGDHRLSGAEADSWLGSEHWSNLLAENARGSFEMRPAACIVQTPPKPVSIVDRLTALVGRLGG